MIPLTIKERADNARKALEPYGGVGEESIADLLADLGHLLDEQGIDYPSLFNKGLRHYMREAEEGASQEARHTLHVAAWKSAEEGADFTWYDDARDINKAFELERENARRMGRKDWVFQYFTYRTDSYRPAEISLAIGEIVSDIFPEEGGNGS